MNLSIYFFLKVEWIHFLFWLFPVIVLHGRNWAYPSLVRLNLFLMCLEVWENCLSLLFTCCLRLGGVCRADVPLRSERWIQKGICHHDYAGDCGTGKIALPMADPEKQDWKEKLREEAECFSVLFSVRDLGLILFLPWGEALSQAVFHPLNKTWLCWWL